MLSFKKNKQHDQPKEGIINSPGRGGRKLLGRTSALLKEDPSSQADNFNFNRPNGYHPSQPLVTSQLTGENSRHETPTMINMSPIGSLTKKEEKPKIKKNLWHRLKRDILLVTLLILAIIGYILMKKYHLY